MRCSRFFFFSIQCNSIGSIIPIIGHYSVPPSRQVSGSLLLEPGDWGQKFADSAVNIFNFGGVFFVKWTK